MNHRRRLWATVGVLILCVRGSARGEPGPGFSTLPRPEQYRIRQMVTPPPPGERYGCYSTPMYYLMHEGYEYEGDLDKDPNGRCYPQLRGKTGPDFGRWKLDRNRPDWQEAMIRNWAELGLNNTHLNIYPLDPSLTVPAPWRQSIIDFVRLSDRYGLKVGVRLDALGGYEAWETNPDNPDNVMPRYLAWVKEVVGLLRGKAAYYILGDELRLYDARPGLDKKLWTHEKYLTYFRQVAGAVKEIEPTAKVSMFGAESGRWGDVLGLLKLGYARYGDAVAINYYNYQDVPRFFDDARRLAPGLLFLSNGVGYVSCAKAEPRYPEGDAYTRYDTEEAHGNVIAKNMFAWWDLGAATAPYYISLRNWVIRGRVYPRWFGFFGFEDFVIDEYDHLTVRRYPGWYAFQTVAHTFYNRNRFRPPARPVSCSPTLTMFRAYEHDLSGGAELVMMLWNDKGPAQAAVRIADRSWRYPVRVSTFNYHHWTDLPHTVSDDGLAMNLEVDPNPVIVRLVRCDPQP